MRLKKGFLISSLVVTSLLSVATITLLTSYSITSKQNFATTDITKKPGNDGSNSNTKPDGSGSEVNKPESKPDGSGSEVSKPESKPDGSGSEENKPESKPDGSGSEVSKPESKPDGSGSEENKPESKPDGSGSEENKPESKPDGSGSEENKPESKPDGSGSEVNKPDGTFPPVEDVAQDNWLDVKDKSNTIPSMLLTREENPTINPEKLVIKYDKEKITNVSYELESFDDELGEIMFIMKYEQKGFDGFKSHTFKFSNLKKIDHDANVKDLDLKFDQLHSQRSSLNWQYYLDNVKDENTFKEFMTLLTQEPNTIFKIWNKKTGETIPLSYLALSGVKASKGMENSNHINICFELIEAKKVSYKKESKNANITRIESSLHGRVGLNSVNFDNRLYVWFNKN